MPSCTATHDSQGLFCTQTFNHREEMRSNRTRALLGLQTRVELGPGGSSWDASSEAGVQIGLNSPLNQLGLLLLLFSIFSLRACFSMTVQQMRLPMISHKFPWMSFGIVK